MVHYNYQGLPPLKRMGSQEMRGANSSISLKALCKILNEINAFRNSSPFSGMGAS